MPALHLFSLQLISARGTEKFCVDSDSFCTVSVSPGVVVAHLSAFALGPYLAPGTKYTPTTHLKPTKLNTL